MNMQHKPLPAEIEAALGLDRSSRFAKWAKRLILLSLVITAISGTLWWYNAASSTTAAYTYQTTAAARTTLVVTVQATGNIQPIAEVDVSSEMSGVVRTVNVKNNSQVKKGDVLAELDSVRLRAQLARVEASLAAAEAHLADARATLNERQTALNRAEALSKKGISSVQDLDSAQAALARAEAGVLAAEADIEVAKAEVSMQETDITKTRILSPVDGIVLKRSVEPGQTVASSLQAPVLFTIAEDLTHMQLEANIDEADIGVVKHGQTASFTVDAYPGRDFPATIETIEFSPNVTDNVVTYKAVLIVSNDELLLRPGMTATAEIVTQELDDVLVVPNAALRYQPPKKDNGSSFSVTSIFMPRPPRPTRQTSPIPTGERSIWILENGSPVELKVKTGATDGKLTQVLSGDLVAGMEVVTSSRQAKE